jgi:hypothetical protein
VDSKVCMAAGWFIGHNTVLVCPGWNTQHTFTTGALSAQYLDK